MSSHWHYDLNIRHLCRWSGKRLGGSQAIGLATARWGQRSQDAVLMAPPGARHGGKLLQMTPQPASQPLSALRINGRMHLGYA